jgi:VWFA-related protein
MPSTPRAALVMSLLAAAVLGAARAEQAQSAQQTPPSQATFRSVVDVVAVDVSVVDRTGRPVDNLKPDEFTLKVDGKLRRIRSAEFVSLRRITEEPETPKDYSSTSAAAPGRLIMLVVDQANIRKGDGKTVFRSAAKFVDSLGRNDRVALQLIPGTGPIVDFTANHGLVKIMLERAVGTAVEADRTGRVGIAEAMAVSEALDDTAMQGVIERECAGDLTPGAVADCRKQLDAAVKQVYSQTRFNTSASLLSLRQIIDRLGLTSEPKTVVLISEGIVVGRNVGDLSWVGPHTAAAQVSLYGIRLSAQGYDVSLGRTSPTRERDQALLADGMDQLIGYGRGTVFSVAVNADAVFSRLALELSGYYLLSFEPGPTDRDGKVHQIAVGVTRGGASVRSRQQFSAEAAGSVKAVDAVLIETLRSALPASDFPVKMTTFAYRDDESGRIKLIVMAEIDRVTNPAGPMGLAFYVVDDHGGLAATSLEKALVPAAGQEGKPQTYMTAVVVDPGTYRLKLAATDGSGHRASVEHSFDASLTAVGQLRMSALMLARPGVRGAPMRPSIDGVIDSSTLIGHMEVYSDAEPQLDSAVLSLEVASTEDGRALATEPMNVNSKPGKRVAQGTVPVSLLAPGNYFARAVLSVGGRPIARVVRPFSIRSDAGASATAPAIAPVSFNSPADRFDPRSVLTRPVVGFFLDRLSITGQPAIPASLTSAIGLARTGQFTEVGLAVEAAQSNHVAGQFLAGLSRLAAGDPNGAAHQFAASLRLAPGFFPATFYLGACYAAAGQDREAILAWRSALVTDPAAPWIFLLLSDALVRANQLPQALAVLNDATKEWPGNDDVLARKATTLARAGEPLQTVTLLDPYFTRHADDAERLLLVMKLIYDARSLNRPIETVELDRARFKRYYDLYTKIPGVDLTLAQQWLRFVER